MPNQPTTKFARFWHGLEKRYLPEYAWQADRLTFWRERILLTLLLLTVFFAPLALIPSVVLAVYEGLWLVAIIDTMAYGVSLWLFLNNHRSLILRAWVVCLLVFSLGAYLMFALGPQGAGYMWLFAAAVLSAGLLGLGAATRLLILSLVVFALVGASIAAGRLDWAADNPNAFQQWLVMALNFLLLNTLITLVTARMLTGMKEALEGEQAVSADLRKSEARFRSLSENAPDIIFTLNQQGRLNYINPAVQHALGYMPQELIGSFFQEVLSEDQRDSLEQSFIDVMSSGRTFQGIEVQLRNRQGHVVPFLLSGAPRLNDADQIDGMVGILKDTTEMRMLEGQLRQAQKMEAVGTLAGGIAHDFNNLLAAITGYAEIAIFEMHDGHTPVEEMEHILDVSDRGKELVRGILTFSRKVDPVLKPADFNREVAVAADMLQRVIPRMITIKLDLDQDLPPVMMDSSQLSQVLMNLGSNAKDAMPDGGDLTIATRRIELNSEDCRFLDDCKPGSYILLKVTDTGQGMPPEVVEHIFDPFFTQKEVGKGTGLGLAMVFGIIKNHGGRVSCQSAPGRGTSFDLYWPLLPAEDQTKRAQQPPEAQLPTGTHTVLVVDDEEDLRATVSSILEKCGFLTMQAKNGEEALEVYRNQSDKIDVVLLDINMPGMGGVRCIKELRAFDGAAKVVIASGYSLNHEESEALEATAFIAKPYRAAELRRTMIQVIGI